jgi:hypothetical protein
LKKREGRTENNILFVIYDRVAMEYSEPKMFVNKSCGVRWFNDCMHKTPYSPDDFELDIVGEMSPDSGCLVAYEKPLFVQRGLTEE